MKERITYTVLEIYYNESSPNDVVEIKEFTKVRDALNYKDKLNEEADDNTYYAVMARWTEEK